MTSRCYWLALLVVTIYVGRSSAYMSYDVCGNFSCPSYRDVQSFGKFSKRCYSPSLWILTTDFWGVSSRSSNFKRVMKYFLGYNSRRAQIPPTLPILEVHGHSLSSQSMLMWIPYDVAMNPPRPTDRLSDLKMFSRRCFFVRSVSILLPTDEDREREARALRNDIRDAHVSMSYDLQSWYVALYDHPFLKRPKQAEEVMIAIL